MSVRGKKQAGNGCGLQKPVLVASRLRNALVEESFCLPFRCELSREREGREIAEKLYGKNVSGKMIV